MVSSMHYCPRPQGQMCTVLSSVPRGIPLTNLPKGHEITVLLPNRTLNITVLLAITNLIGTRLQKARDFLVTFDVIGHCKVYSYFMPVW